MPCPVSDQLAVCSWSLRPECPGGLAATLRALGIPRVQLALLPLLEDGATWCDTGRALADQGVRIISGMMQTVGEDYSTLESIARTGGVRPDESWPATLDRALRTADLAASLGLTLVTFHAGFIPHEAGPARATMLARLRTLVDHFATRGVSLAFETGQETASTLLAALDELERPSAGVNLDPANMILYGMGDPVAAARSLLPRIAQVHVKDARASASPGTWGQEVPVGSGDVAWPAFLEVLASAPRTLDLVIEREAGSCRESDITGAKSVIEREWR